MNQSGAADVSTRMAEAHAALASNGEEVERTYKRVDKAIFSHAFMIPGDAVVAVLTPEGGPPTVAAFDGDQLYLLTVGEFEEGLLAEPPTKCRMLHVTMGVGTVEMEATYRGEAGSKAQRDTTWRFKLDGANLTIATHFDPEGNRVAKDEVLAQALAKALGWNLPDPKVRSVGIGGIDR